MSTSTEETFDPQEAFMIPVKMEDSSLADDVAGTMDTLLYYLKLPGKLRGIGWPPIESLIVGGLGS